MLPRIGGLIMREQVMTATSDLDRDGDLDLIVASLDEPVKIQNNNLGNSLTVSLRGNSSNRFGIGATVKIKTTGVSN